MAQQLNKQSKLDEDRRTRFSQKYLKEVEQLVGMVSSEIAEKHIKVYTHSVYMYNDCVLQCTLTGCCGLDYIAIISKTKQAMAVCFGVHIMCT